MQVCNTERLSIYVDGDLHLPERLALEHHLRVCHLCREEVGRLRHVNSVMIAWGAQRRYIPQRTETRIIASVERRSRMRRVAALSRMAPAVMGSGVAAVLVLLSANYGLTNRPTPTVQSTVSKATVQQIIKHQTDALQRVRRTQAILGNSSPSSAIASSRHRAFFSLD
jgi:anti-sigma factor RsiW